MFRINRIILCAVVACVSVCAASEKVDELLKAGRYQEAQRLATGTLEAVRAKPLVVSLDAWRDVITIDLLMHRLTDVKNAVYAVESIMAKNPLPESNVQWLSYYHVQMAVYTELGELQKADLAFDGAQKKARLHGWENSLLYAKLLELRARTLMDQQRILEAVTVREAQLARLQGNSSTKTFEEGKLLLELGKLSLILGRLEVSSTYFVQAEPLLEHHYRAKTPNPRDSVEAMTKWVIEAYAVRDYEKWQECDLRLEWIRVYEQELGTDNGELIEPLTDTASYCEEALSASVRVAFFDRALDLASRHFGLLHSNRLYVMDHLGTYYASREYSEALQRKGEAILKEMRQLRTKQFEEAPNTTIAATLYDLANELPNDCMAFASGTCKAKLDTELAKLRAAWGASHPALFALQLYIVQRLGGFSSSEERPKDRERRDHYVVSLCENTLQQAKHRFGEASTGAAYVAYQCAENGLNSHTPEMRLSLSEYAKGIFEAQFGKDDALTRQATKNAEHSRLWIEHQQSKRVPPKGAL